MKQIVKRLATGMAWSLIVLAGAIVIAPQEASAHGVSDIRYVDYGYRHAPRRSIFRRHAGTG